MLGRIVQLQVQAEPLKATGRYDPTHLVAADRAMINQAGMLIPDAGGWLVDAHHQAHPRARGGGNRALSVGFTGHYTAMADRFGSVPVGTGGENVIIDGPAVRMQDIPRGLAVHRPDGTSIELTAPRPAAPCLPFTSFLLGSDEVLERDEIRDELEFLSHGIRGFIVTTDHLDHYAEIAVGDNISIR